MTDDIRKDLLRLTASQVPAAFVNELQRLLPKIYQESFASCFHEAAWDEPEARDLVGHVRRAIVEAQVRRLAKKAGIIATPLKNRRKTASHTLVRAGRIVFTVSAISREARMARAAHFRKQHAAVNHIFTQPTLAGLDIEPPELFEAGEIYAILFHGPSAGNPKELGFACFGFPDSESRRADIRFSLIEVSRAQTGTEVAPVAEIDNVTPKWKRKQGQINS